MTSPRILVPWGGGRHAHLGLELAARLSAATGASIDVLRIVRDDVDIDKERAVIERAMDDAVGLTPFEVIVRTGEDIADVITSVAGEHGPRPDRHRRER